LQFFDGSSIYFQRIWHIFVIILLFSYHSILIGIIQIFINHAALLYVMSLKQVIVTRHDLKMSKGKLAAQVAHGSLESALKASKIALSTWRRDGAKKVVLKAENTESLYRLKQQCEDTGVVCSLISDAGHTELAPGTVTVLGIGPDEEEKIDRLTGMLQML